MRYGNAVVPSAGGPRPGPILAPLARTSSAPREGVRWYFAERAACRDDQQKEVNYRGRRAQALFEPRPPRLRASVPDGGRASTTATRRRRTKRAPCGADTPRAAGIGEGRALRLGVPGSPAVQEGGFRNIGVMMAVQSNKRRTWRLTSNGALLRLRGGV